MKKNNIKRNEFKLIILTNPLNRSFYEIGDHLDNQINGYVDKLSNDISNLDKELQKNFVNNIKCYETYILQLFNKYQTTIKSSHYKNIPPPIHKNF